MNTGSLGETPAGLALQRIGWAPPVRFSEDIGDDLLTFARDTIGVGGSANSWDLAAPVIVQAKGSPSAYRSPRHRTRSRNSELGWWYSESKETEFDHWLEFGMPYLLVLVDTQAEIAYWTAVTPEAIDSSTKKRRIFVPQSQVISADSHEQLNKFAVSRRSNQLEGLVWDGVFDKLRRADRYRFALVVPRLIATHINRAAAPAEPEQAIARLLRGSPYREEEDESAPPRSEWAGHERWGWRFAAAIGEALASEGDAPLAELTSVADLAWERDACAVLTGCVRFMDGRTESALEAFAAEADSLPADRGWILAHRAAMLLELDQPDEARTTAQEAIVAMRSLDGDLTVSAIRGAAASVLYQASEFGSVDGANTFRASDNASSWWRAQDAREAMSRDLEYRFERWSHDDTVHYVRLTPVEEMRTLAFQTALCAAWGGWRHLIGQAAQMALTAPDGADESEEALRDLIAIGDTKRSKSAADQLWTNGPTSALRAVIAEIVQVEWSLRAEGAVLAVLAAGGDLLAVDDADACLARVLRLIPDKGPTRRFAHSFSHRWSEVERATRRLLAAASALAHTACALMIAEEFPASDEYKAGTLVRIASDLRLDVMPRHVGRDPATTRSDL